MKVMRWKGYQRAAWRNQRKDQAKGPTPYPTWRSDRPHGGKGDREGTAREGPEIHAQERGAPIA